MKVLLLLVPAALLPGMWSVLFVFAGYVPKHRLVMSRKQANGEILTKLVALDFTRPPMINQLARWAEFCLFCKCRCKVENCDDEDDPGFDQPWLNFTVPPGDFVIFVVNIKVLIVIRVNRGRIRSLSDVQEV